MQKRDKITFIVQHFSKSQPETASELNFSNEYQLLVATILAAQCTDKRVNMITPTLFAQYPDATALSQASLEEILELIKSVSYPNNKAKHLQTMSQQLVATFGGQVPSTMQELIGLAGVGRKTANVVLAFAFHQPAMPVDTHVFRVSNRLGIVKEADTPEKVEQQLVEQIPAEHLSNAHHWLLLHGRYVCTARKPKCEECPLTPICDFHKNNS